MDLGVWDFELDKNTPIPLYYQLKQHIICQIKDHKLNVGDCIATEVEFCANLNISRPTIRQALQELVAEGYLYRIKGKGTFVSTPKINETFFQELQSFNDEMIQKGLKPSTKVLDLKVIKGIDRINEKLGIDPQDDLICLRRLRFANVEPIVYLETYLRYLNCVELLKEDFVNMSLYQILEDKYNIKVVKVSRQIEAVNTDTNTAVMLNIKKSQAICLVKTVSFTSENQPVEYSVARYRGDLNQFSVVLHRS
jgi:GntR family transcriptional regulator